MIKLLRRWHILHDWGDWITIDDKRPRSATNDRIWRRWIVCSWAYEKRNCNKCNHYQSKNHREVVVGSRTYEQDREEDAIEYYQRKYINNQKDKP